MRRVRDNCPNERETPRFENLAFTQHDSTYPHLFLLKYHSSRECIELDIERWSNCRNPERGLTRLQHFYAFVSLMTFHPEYRNLFYHRLGWAGKMLFLCVVQCTPLHSYEGYWARPIYSAWFRYHYFCKENRSELLD